MWHRDGTRTGSRSPAANRREFLKAAAGAVAVPYVITSAALGAGDRPAASERIVMGGIGIGNMGSGDMGAFLGRGDVQYVAVCDVRKGVREGARGRANQRYGNSDCKAYNDFQELLARDDIDAVHVATPDHWHALIVVAACRTGKDAYCQKPETRTLREGRLMVDAARRYGCVVSGGSQRVLEDYRGVVNQCWGGELGTIKSINVNVGPLPKPCNLAGEPVPDGFDWDRWLGPAPWAPYHPYRCSGSYAINGTSWRSFSDYSGGGMTDWGAHHFGGATFAVDVRELEPEEVVYHNDHGREHLTYRYPNGLLLYHNHPGAGNLQVEGTPGEKREAKPVPTYKGQGGIYGDFIECCKTREKPFRDIELAVHTATVSHLGLIAYELKRSLKWDQAAQEFPGDDEANRLVDRARREPWVL
ncbi:MAG: Gfo/Idh/MocA family oxidoreductase [Pirellulales bacterium]|nr:Gfo/Idh/MocA family oxidoreductase [Pirellulales bacterium]